MNKNIFRVSAIFIFSTSVFYVSCKKNKTNQDLYNECKLADLTFYKSKDTIYDAKGGSPHGNFKLKFNSKAVASFGNDGKLPVGQNFNDGALIVKEVYSGAELILYAVMKKDSKSKYGANKWLWAEYKPNGDAAYNVAEQGKSCTSCHSTGIARDFIRSFDLH